VKVAVIGTGYVGLVVGACLAETGNDVLCADVDGAKIAGLKENRLPIYEPGLEPLVVRNQREGRLQFTTEVGRSVERSDVIVIAVGTPPDEDGSADLQHVLAVARAIGQHMNQPKIVITKSTVPVGTAARIRAEIEKHTSVPFHVCSNPEFLKEGAAVDDFMKPDRVIVGVDSEDAGRVLAELYAPFVRTGNPIIFMDTPSAEMTKYAANAMLATRISFMNQMARLCEAVGADVTLVRKGIGSDRRIGPAFLFPGPGYGGSCFPKDVKALLRTAELNGMRFDILESVEAANERQKRLLFEKVERHFDGKLAGTVVAVWGSHSRRRRTTCARVRRSSSWRRCCRPAPRCGCTTRLLWRAPGDTSATASPTPPMPTKPSTAPPRWSSSPNGSSTATPTSTGSNDCWCDP